MSSKVAKIPVDGKWTSGLLDILDDPILGKLFAWTTVNAL
jgi:hypothetical protein